MYYSAIGTLAIIVLLILNHDILLDRGNAFQAPAWRVYRRFLFAVLAYYITDILWGILESRRLALLLFADTTVYFIAMAAGVLFWSQYTVAYLEDETAFGKVLVYAGRIIAGLITVVTIANIFVPVLFTVDGDCVYRALPIRYLMLISQILLLLLISNHAIFSIVLRGKEKRLKYRTLAFFGMITAAFLFIQLWYPYLPLYSIAYMLGTCLLHTFVINDEKEDYRRRLEEAYEKERSTGTIFAHIAMSLAQGYTDLFYVNMDTDEYTEYHADDASGALTEVRHGTDFFESCKREVKLFVHPEDNAAFVKAMDRQFLTEALNRTSVFEMTYRRIKEGDPFYVRMKVTRMKDDDRFIVIGVTDIDEQVKHRRAEERMKEERAVYDRIHALTGNFIAIYMVEPETDRYREYGAADDYQRLGQAKEGEKFFDIARETAPIHIYSEDLNRFLSVFTKENVMAEIERSGIFTLHYRLMMDGRPNHVLLKVIMAEEKEGTRLLVGIYDIDVQVRQEEEYGRRLAQAKKEAYIDALTGVKNRHAYLEAEAHMDRQIRERSQSPFAIVMLDINDLKKINDTAGHQAGDQYLRDACKTICDTFKHSPVFRVGGDEFAVIAQGRDYTCIEELLEIMSHYNADAYRNGGIMIACGMAKFEDDECVASVFERADHSMYENKLTLKALR
ncbi:MAG: GGDEF domain-containing protein [Candidatus Limivicinus sp.]